MRIKDFSLMIPVNRTLIVVFDGGYMTRIYLNLSIPHFWAWVEPYFHAVTSDEQLQ